MGDPCEGQQAELLTLQHSPTTLGPSLATGCCVSKGDGPQAKPLGEGCSQHTCALPACLGLLISGQYDHGAHILSGFCCPHSHQSEISCDPHMIGCSGLREKQGSGLEVLPATFSLSDL